MLLNGHDLIDNRVERRNWNFLWNKNTREMKIVYYKWTSMNEVCNDLVTILALAMLSDYHEELPIKETILNSIR